MEVISIILLQLLMVTVAQRVAPGVPPQQYQAPPPPQQQYQQVPVQHQQVPVQHQQFQQVPVQQQYQQVPVQQQQYQQVPVQQQQHYQVPQQQIPTQQYQVPGAHMQGHHVQSQQILNAANVVHEKQHIAEHLEVPIDTSKMTEQELQFHYFKMHDADNNNKLDGCELIKSLIHWHEQGHKDPNQPGLGGEKLFKDEELVNLIDPILSMDDGNNDGFIDYAEFIRAQQKAAAKPGP